MNANDQLANEKESILENISRIDSMRKGTINEQTIKTRQKDGSIKGNGPYYILTSKDTSGKTVTESIPKEKLEFYRREIENYKEYKKLVAKYEVLSEESSRRKVKDNNLVVDMSKKNRKLK